MLSCMCTKAAVCYVRRHLVGSPGTRTLLAWLLPQTGLRGCPLCAQVLNIGQLYLGGEVKYTLHSMVCFYGAHFQSFARSQEPLLWLLLDDARVSEAGDYQAVVKKCVLGHMQPSVLFFELASPS